MQKVKRLPDLSFCLSYFLRYFCSVYAFFHPMVFHRLLLNLSYMGVCKALKIFRKSDLFFWLPVCLLNGLMVAGTEALIMTLDGTEITIDCPNGRYTNAEVISCNFSFFFSNSKLNFLYKSTNLITHKCVRLQFNSAGVADIVASTKENSGGRWASFWVVGCFCFTS